MKIIVNENGASLLRVGLWILIVSIIIIGLGYDPGSTTFFVLFVIFYGLELLFDYTKLQETRNRKNG